MNACENIPRFIQYVKCMDFGIANRLNGSVETQQTACLE